MPAESDHHFSSLVPPVSLREIGELVGAVDIQDWVEAKEGLQSPLVRDHHTHFGLARPMYHLD